MRLAALLTLAFASVVSLWGIVGMHIMRGAFAVTLVGGVEVRHAADLEPWLLSFTRARSGAVEAYPAEDRDSF